MDTQSHNSTHQTPITMSLAMVAGVGVVLIVIAVGIGAIQGENADANMIGLTAIGGMLFFLFGAIGWYMVVQPQKHFDDINIPQDTGHHAHDAHDQEDAANTHG